MRTTESCSASCLLTSVLPRKRVKGLCTMTVNLEEKKKQMIAEMEALAEELKAGRGDSEELRKKISKLDLDLQKVLDNLTDKRNKWEIANKQLSELRQIEEETRERALEYRRDLKAATYDLEHQVRYRPCRCPVGRHSA